MEFDFEENQENQDLFFDKKIFDDIFHYEDRIIFLVEFEALDFQNNGLPENNLSIFMKAFGQFLKNKMISNNSCKVGLIFYGMQKSCNDFDFDQIYVFHALDSIQAEWIKNLPSLEQFIQSQFQIQKQENQHADLSKVFSVCEQQFNQCQSQIKTKYQRIFLFTIQDNPYFESVKKKQIFEKQIQNLQDSNIEIDLFPLLFGEPHFQVTRFYGQVLQIDLDEINSEFLEPISKLEQLNLKLKKKEQKKRPIYKSKLNLGSNTQIGIKIYSIYQKLKKQSSISLDKENNTILKKIKISRISSNREKVSQDLLEKRYVIGDEQILMTEEDLDQIKNFVQEQFSLLGFKPKSSLKNYMNINSSFFLVPDDTQIQGSSQSIDALLKEMIKKDKVGIIKLKPKNSYLKFAFLVPQLESVVDGQFEPSGFHVIIAPFADDIRNLEDLQNQEQIDITKEDLLVASQLVQGLSIDQFNPRNFENPNLQHFYQILQDLALNEKSFGEIEDYLVPDLKGLQQKSHIIENFNNHFFGCDNEKNSIFEEDNQNENQDIKSQQLSREKTDTKSEKSSEQKNGESNQIIEKVLNDEKVLIKDLNSLLKHYQIPFNSKTKKVEKIELIKNHLSQKQ